MVETEGWRRWDRALRGLGAATRDVIIAVGEMERREEK